MYGRQAKGTGGQADGRAGDRACIKGDTDPTGGDNIAACQKRWEVIVVGAHRRNDRRQGAGALTESCLGSMFPML